MQPAPTTSPRALHHLINDQFRFLHPVGTRTGIGTVCQTPTSFEVQSAMGIRSKSRVSVSRDSSHWRRLPSYLHQSPTSCAAAASHIRAEVVRYTQPPKRRSSANPHMLPGLPEFEVYSPISSRDGCVTCDAACGGHHVNS